MNKILITRKDGRVLTAVWDGSRVLEFLTEEEKEVRVGDIFLGRISSVSKNIQAAFVEVKPGVLCFLPLSDRGKKRKAGEILPVIVTREAVKTKEPVVSDCLSLNGRYLVLVSDHSRISVSQKIRSKSRREELKELLEPEAEENLGFIVRTNAETAPDETILAEAEQLKEEYRDLLEKAPHRTVFSQLKSGMPSWLSSVRDARTGSVDEVVTDQEDIHRELLASPETAGLFPEGAVRLYRDSYPMEHLYRIGHFLEMALSRRVWLGSGGYLVIEYTEAMTVIDVNTGKYDGHKNRQETFRRINLEAAEEIALQMRLRNLSGIIIVDFIDLDSPEHRLELKKTLSDRLAKDPQKAVLVDFTALGLAEITRKKVRKPLYETMRSSGGKQDV